MVCRAASSGRISSVNNNITASQYNSTPGVDINSCASELY